MSSDHPDRASQLAGIADAAIDLVAAAMHDEDIPAAKRADMALSLLGKQAVKDAATPDDEDDSDIIDVMFVCRDDNGDLVSEFGYSFQPRTSE